MKVFGNLRKRWVLGAIFFTSVFYFIYNTGTQLSSKQLTNEVSLLEKVKNSRNAENILRKLKWHSSKLNNNISEMDERSDKENCRNSMQGQNIIADEEGFVCSRKDTKLNGCCDVNGVSTYRYQCEMCLPSNCCSIYEHCVSCCMNPDKRALLEKIIRETVSNLQQMVLSTLEDQFDLCLTKCRTSSGSVQHENTYRDAKFKHCFGRNLPDIKLIYG